MSTQLYAVGTAVVTVKNPDAGFQVLWQHVGHAERMLNGSLRRHYQAIKGQWEVTWSHLSSGDRSTLVTELRKAVPMGWKPPDEATTYNVLVAPNFTMVPTEFGWTVSATLAEI